MSKLFDEYYSRYEEAIRPGIEAGSEYVVKPYAWIALRFVTDRGIDNPWKEPEKMKKLVDELELAGEHKMIDAIAKTMEDVKNEI